jgi:hypothetical protein
VHQVGENHFVHIMRITKTQVAQVSQVAQVEGKSKGVVSVRRRESCLD